jgi:hypothetical protein
MRPLNVKILWPRIGIPQPTEAPYDRDSRNLRVYPCRFRSRICRIRFIIEARVPPSVLLGLLYHLYQSSSTVVSLAATRPNSRNLQYVLREALI